MTGIMGFIGDRNMLVGRKSEFPSKEEFLAEIIKKCGPTDYTYRVDDVGQCYVAYRLNQDIFEGENGYIAYFEGEKPRGGFPCWYVEEI